MQQADVLKPASHSYARNIALSKRIWNLDWSALLPWQFEDVSVESGSFDEALPFIKEHYGSIFGADQNVGRFLQSPMTDAKYRFSKETDIFLFRIEGRTIGVFMSHPSDWSTYYLRTAGLLPEYQGRKLIPRLMERLCEPLRAVGVERLEADVSPANIPSMRLYLGQGYVATSTACSERWGAIIHFTKFLSAEADATFRRQFCNTPSFKEERESNLTAQRRTS